MDGRRIVRESIHTTKAWLKSHLIMGGVVAGLLLVGLSIINYCISDFGNIIGIILLALGLAIFDVLPALGLILPMMLWAALAVLIAGDKPLGISIAVLCFLVMIIKQILEPYIIGKTMGISAWEEILSSLVCFAILGFNAVGLLVGPIIYTIGKTIVKIYMHEKGSR